MTLPFPYVPVLAQTPPPESSPPPETASSVPPQTVELSPDQFQYLAELLTGWGVFLTALLLVCIFLLAAISVRSMT